MSQEGDRIKKTIGTVLGFLCGDDDEAFVKELDKREGSNLHEQFWGAPAAAAGPQCRFCQRMHPVEMACAAAAQMPTAAPAPVRCLLCFRLHLESQSCSSAIVEEAPLRHVGPLRSSSSTVEAAPPAAPASSSSSSCARTCRCGGRGVVTVVDEATKAQYQEACPWRAQSK